MTPFNLKRKIMLRIYLLFVLRNLKNPLIQKALLFILSLATLASRVSISHVVANTPHSIPGMYHFSIAAFMNTKLAVQVVLLVICIVAFLLAKDFASRIQSRKLAI